MLFSGGIWCGFLAGLNFYEALKDDAQWSCLFGSSCPRDYTYTGTAFAIPSIVLIGGSTWNINKKKGDQDWIDDYLFNFRTINLEILDENLIKMFLHNKWYLSFMFLSIANILPNVY